MNVEYETRIEEAFDMNPHRFFDMKSEFKKQKEEQGFILTEDGNLGFCYETYRRFVLKLLVEGKFVYYDWDRVGCNYKFQKFLALLEDFKKSQEIFIKKGYKFEYSYKKKYFEKKENGGISRTLMGKINMELIKIK